MKKSRKSSANSSKKHKLMKASSKSFVSSKYADEKENDTHTFRLRAKDFIDPSSFLTDEPELRRK